MSKLKRFAISLLLIFGFTFVYFFPTSGITGNEFDSTIYFPPDSKTLLSETLKTSILDYESSDEESNVEIQCSDLEPVSYYDQSEEYWVLKNYFRGTKIFHCDESITYTTHAEYSYLDNVAPLLERWEGPISISVYSPGTDFMETITRIKYLRECSQESSLIKMYATFHIFFEAKHIPLKIIPKDPDDIKIDCSMANPLLEDNTGTSYRKRNNLTYPINMGRMIARDMSTTYYVLPSDIELYPNPNVIPNFLKMIHRNDKVLQSPNPKVFVLSIFEIDESVEQLPYNKSELVQMLKTKKVIPFHKYVCPYCHRIPQGKEWARAPIKPGMHVYHVAKREGKYRFWEPIYIGTKFDPGYDIRLNWEGMRDKMTQGFILRSLDYEFHILDNAFLIHRPGIKRHPSTRSQFQKLAAWKQNRLIERKIYPELQKLYGGDPSLEYPIRKRNRTSTISPLRLENATTRVENDIIT